MRDGMSGGTRTCMPPPRLLEHSYMAWGWELGWAPKFKYRCGCDRDWDWRTDDRIREAQSERWAVEGRQAGGPTLRHGMAHRE